VDDDEEAEDEVMMAAGRGETAIAAERWPRAGSSDAYPGGDRDN
jgi:hypothetical protein